MSEFIACHTVKLYYFDSSENSVSTLEKVFNQVSPILVLDFSKKGTSISYLYLNALFLVSVLHFNNWGIAFTMKIAKEAGTELKQTNKIMYSVENIIVKSYIPYCKTKIVEAWITIAWERASVSYLFKSWSLRLKDYILFHFFFYASVFFAPLKYSI